LDVTRVHEDLKSLQLEEIRRPSVNFPRDSFTHEKLSHHFGLFVDKAAFREAFKKVEEVETFDETVPVEIIEVK
jgi:hypothetical protein